MGGRSYTADSFNQNSSNPAEFHQSMSNSQEEAPGKMDGSSSRADSLIENYSEITESEQSIIGGNMDGSSCREDSIIQDSSDAMDSEQSISSSGSRILQPKTREEEKSSKDPGEEEEEAKQSAPMLGYRMITFDTNLCRITTLSIPNL